MCKQAFARFQCGHSVAASNGVTRCEWARASNRDCPDFQTQPDEARSNSVYGPCMACATHGAESKKSGKLFGKKGKASRG